MIINIFTQIWNYFFAYEEANGKIIKEQSVHKTIVQGNSKHADSKQLGIKAVRSYKAKDNYPLLYNRYMSVVPDWEKTLNSLFPPDKYFHPSFRQVSGSVDFITTNSGIKYNGQALKQARENIFSNIPDVKQGEKYLNTLRSSFQNVSTIRHFDLALDVPITDTKRDQLFLKIMRHISLGLYTSRYDVFGFLFNFYNRIVIKKCLNGLPNIVIFNRSSSAYLPAYSFTSWEELSRYLFESEELRGKAPSTIYFGGVDLKTGQLDFRKGKQRSQVILYDKYKEQNFNPVYKGMVRLEFRYRFHPADFSQSTSKNISIGLDLIKQFNLVLEKSAHISSFRELLHSKESRTFQTFLGRNLSRALSLRKIPSIPPKQVHIKNLALDPEWKELLSYFSLTTFPPNRAHKEQSVIHWGDGSANVVLEDTLANFHYVRSKRT